MGDSNFALGLASFTYIVPDFERAWKAGKRTPKTVIPELNDVIFYLVVVYVALLRPKMMKTRLRLEFRLQAVGFNELKG